jgi:hypothetical protein
MFRVSNTVQFPGLVWAQSLGFYLKKYKFIYRDLIKVTHEKFVGINTFLKKAIPPEKPV